MHSGWYHLYEYSTLRPHLSYHFALKITFLIFYNIKNRNYIVKAHWRNYKMLTICTISYSKNLRIASFCIVRGTTHWKLCSNVIKKLQKHARLFCLKNHAKSRHTYKFNQHMSIVVSEICVARLFYISMVFSTSIYGTNMPFKLDIFTNKFKVCAKLYTKTAMSQWRLP